ncbi:MAG: alpha/beta fold hydrolase [Bacteroidota bacterium]
MIRNNTGSWVAFRKPNPRATIRLFCFPYAGAGAALFRSWMEKLPESIEVCPVELPGRGQRILERPFDRISPLVDALHAGLLPYLDKPFALFGHSLGALVGFEIARVLQERDGRTADHLFVSGCRAPHVREVKSRYSELTDEEFIRELQHLNGTPGEVLADDELMELILPTLRADFAVCERYDYVADRPLSIPITSFGGSEDTMVKPEHIEPWRELTTGPFSLQVLRGDHFFMNRSESELLGSISNTLCPMQERRMSESPAVTGFEEGRRTSGPQNQISFAVGGQPNGRS